ncbi:peptidase domain-containing ABC transporter [Chryseobacterium wangxinyae]|uniref:peptidase domain-containing ABC transporter n=1 Tax=Chryseobacterium sp. CY353 TaxID=2997334 RepID=UPI00227119A5|nr:peptidase domain-containing ABC transporter [Chryseobacterium sp. CY353]MCY0971132.1 peptidase domain-containing ABC transporter [Chryseobacterium sp. CY353]
MRKFPFYKQPDAKDCGPTCLRIISKYYGKELPIQKIRSISETTRLGSSLLGLRNAAKILGFKTLGVQINFKELVNDLPLPSIVHWNKNHFVVIYKVSKKRGGYTIYISDPSYGLIKYSKDEFIRSWIGENANDKTKEGIALILDTTPAFFDDMMHVTENRNSFKFLSGYLLKYKSLLIQLFVGLLITSVLSLVLPFLTQSIVDVGIQNQDLNFINLVLIAQILAFLGRISVEIIRSWILLHLSTRINMSIISDFFIKLMNLPIGFFDTRITGDILQRINDHKRIEQLLTTSSLNTLFSLANIFIFSTVLLLYDFQLVAAYIFGAILYIIWIIFFLDKRKELDYKRFSQVAQEQGKVIELISGMQEIKMYNADKQKRWGWEFLQIRLFKLKIESLKLEQWQSIGGNFLNQVKDILISFLSAKLVLDGKLTLGMMLSVQYIIGQLNGSLLQLIDFLKRAQDAKISLERLNEIHEKEDEENSDNRYVSDIPKEDIQIENLSFRYIGADRSVFENLNLTIPHQGTTAIVGTSGSGKSTLLKLLMKFYEPNQGVIKIGSTDLTRISPKFWRNHCGVVMQDGYIFNDTIANNIIIGEDKINPSKLQKAINLANLKDFIETLPLNYNTKIGNEGIGISGGQKQRVFIARAVYKEPDYVFFDEATSALDANNEKQIMKNLKIFFEGKTAVIIAHRLSTVKNADKIIVLDNGKVIEEGTHNQLVVLKGAYFKLVKNQLELGN